VKNSVLVYQGDFGVTPITDETLKAYSVEFLKGVDRKWRRSSKNRENVQRMYRDLEAVQRYFWVRDEDREKL
jgi:hypothetical protein